ncbi:DUF1127 domain-containing protein [Reinekea sp. G2M2-21]|uniref:DUF1127 domain-containing protein n=1 Tax=Reinekea sp. G2M2-21 TaxID=2788942 RepID=UPI002729BDCC|nr:DUF1127 domain-containing protein [Reinekea sp. G2M2-21]
MTTMQTNLTLPTIRVPGLAWIAAVQAWVKQRQTRNALASLSSEQLKDIGLYRDQRTLASTLNRQLW